MKPRLRQLAPDALRQRDAFKAAAVSGLSIGTKTRVSNMSRSYSLLDRHGGQVELARDSIGPLKSSTAFVCSNDRPSPARSRTARRPPAEGTAKRARFERQPRRARRSGRSFV
jgi:hypothetical protein